MCASALTAAHRSTCAETARRQVQNEQFFSTESHSSGGAGLRMLAEPWTSVEHGRSYQGECRCPLDTTHVDTPRLNRCPSVTALCFPHGSLSRRRKVAAREDCTTSLTLGG